MAGAYIVFLILMLIYVAIMGMKLARIENGLKEVADIAEGRREDVLAEEPSAVTEVES